MKTGKATLLVLVALVALFIAALIIGALSDPEKAGLAERRRVMEQYCREQYVRGVHDAVNCDEHGRPRRKS